MATRRALGACLALATYAGGSPMSGTNSTMMTTAPYSNLSLSTSSTMSTDTATSTATLASAPAHAYGGPAADSYYSPAWIPVGQSSLQSTLNQSQTNGGSTWGTENAPNISKWLETPGQPMPSGTPWGGANANTNPNDVPNTGMTRSYNFVVSSAVIAPDGVDREVMLVNGQYPGPLLEANWGDYFEITVTNNLATEGTALHWHGLLQTSTPWYDGVPGVQMCPIAPGSSFTYRFQADLYGTSWYHSHYSAQYAGGLSGPMIIYGPTNVDYDLDLGPVMVSDWSHKSYYSLVEQTLSPVSLGLSPVESENNLINGKMNFPCANTTEACVPNAGISKFSFISGKTYRLRLINHGAEGMQKFSIDNHTMTIIANDFVPIVPYETDVVTLAVGQRSDVIVTAAGNPGDAVWMRSNIVCSSTDGISPNAVAAIYYEGADNNSLPTTNSTVSAADLARCANDPLNQTQPYYSITPTPEPSTTETKTVTLAQNDTGNPTESYDLWYINNSTFRTDYNDPILLEAKLGNTTFAPERNVFNTGSNSSVRIILVNTFVETSHPMHLHGHNMYVLAEGFGTWDGIVTNPDNPQRRDVQLLQQAQDADTPAYFVMQIEADNPGVWPFHCHIAWHVSAGLYFQLLERPDDIYNDSALPGVLAQTCRDWTSYTGDHMPDQIDSGL